MAPAKVFTVAMMLGVLAGPRVAHGFSVSPATTQAAQNKALEVMEAVSATTLPSSCPVQPSADPISCYTGTAFVATVPGAQGCVCSNGNVYVTYHGMGPCTLAGCATLGANPSPGATSVTPMSMSQMNSALGMPAVTSVPQGANSICATFVLSCNGTASACGFDMPGAGMQVQGGLNASTVASSEGNTGPAESSSVSTYVENGCSTQLAALSGEMPPGAIVYSSFCNDDDCNKPYQAPHGGPLPTVKVGESQNSMTGGVAGGRKMLRWW